MADAAAKMVQTALLDTWSVGNSVVPLVTDLTGSVMTGDSIDIPSVAAPTVNTTETANPEAVTTSVDALPVNRTKFINREITDAGMTQLLNGNGNYAMQLMRSSSARLLNAVDLDAIQYLYTEVAGTSAANHFNLGADTLTDTDINDCEAAMREQQGVANSNDGSLFWIMSPTAAGQIKSVADLNPADAVAVAQATGSFTNMGLPMIGNLNGIPAFLNNHVPGRTDSLRHQAAVNGQTSITSNVLTIPLAAGHGFVVGQQVFTSGLTTNVTNPPATAGDGNVVTSSATEITVALTTTNAADNGSTGTVFSASAYAMLVYRDWTFYAANALVPRESLVERSDAAGWALKLTTRIGRVAHAGAVKVIHTSDGI